MIKRTSKLFATLALVLAGLVTSATPAAAVAPTAVPAGLKAPHGSVVKGGYVVGPDGAMMALATGQNQACPSGWWCLYEHAYWNGTGVDGRMLQFGGTYSGNLSDWGFNDMMSSFRNNSGTDARWYENNLGTWFNPCHNMPKWSSSSSVQPNDSASGIVGGGLC